MWTGAPHLRARGTSVSRLARSAVVTLSAGEMEVSVGQDKQVKTGITIEQVNSRPLRICQEVQGVHGDQQGPLGKRKEQQHFQFLKPPRDDSCSFQEEVLRSVQALRAHQRVRCVPEVPGGRAETMFRVLTGWINAQKFRLRRTKCGNLQEVRGVQEGLWNPSCPAEKHKVGQQEKV